MQSATANLAHTEPELAISQQDYRNAMAQLGAGVNIITTDGPHGRAGFTATAVCSITDSPATLLVCLNQSASVYPVFSGNGVLCVNVLHGEHRALSNLFGGKTAMAERFAAARWCTASTGAPLLDGALASFDCHIVRTLSVGSHDVLVCEVAALSQSAAANGLVYFRRAYHALA